MIIKKNYLQFTTKLPLLLCTKKVVAKSAFCKNSVFVKVREGSVKASVKLKAQMFKNAAFVKVREGSVKGSVKAFQKHWVREGPVKVREGFR